MKQNIHPTYHTKAAITCSCGAVLTVGSTQESMQTEICSQCHPFYTGKKKIIDTTGRVDRFKKMFEKASEKKKVVEKTREEKVKREKEREEKAKITEKKQSKKKTAAKAEAKKPTAKKTAKK